MLTALLVVLAILFAFPAGLALAYLTRDELVHGRPYFKILSLLAFITALLLIAIEEIISSLTLLFIAIVALVSLWKSYNKRFVK